MQEGAARIAGRLFALLMIQEEPCSLDAIAELLRVTRPGDRRDYCQVADNMGERMLTLAVARLQQMTGLAGAAPHPARGRGRTRADASAASGSSGQWCFG